MWIALERFEEEQHLLDPIRSLLGWDIPLSGDNNGLVLLVANHAAVSILGNGEQMGLKLTTSPTRIGLDDVLGVEVDTGEGVGSDQHDSRVSVDVAVRVTGLDVAEDYFKDRYMYC